MTRNEIKLHLMAKVFGRVIGDRFNEKLRYEPRPETTDIDVYFVRDGYQAQIESVNPMMTHYRTIRTERLLHVTEIMQSVLVYFGSLGNFWGMKKAISVSESSTINRKMIENGHFLTLLENMGFSFVDEITHFSWEVENNRIHRVHKCVR